MCRALVFGNEHFVERENLLTKLRKSKIEKIMRAVKLIVGGWKNWAMVVAGWLGDFLEGVVDGAIMFYRSELLIVAQRVAAATAANHNPFRTTSASALSSSGRISRAVPYGELLNVVSAILISEMSKIIVGDLKRKVDDLGEKAIRKRLEYMLGERLLAQVRAREISTYVFLGVFVFN